MPYVKKEVRRELELQIRGAETAGELNYQVTLLAIKFVRNHGLNYETLNAVVGALESAKAEFQRRVVAPYEDTKIAKNGDVYP